MHCMQVKARYGGVMLAKEPYILHPKTLPPGEGAFCNLDQQHHWNDGATRIMDFILMTGAVCIHSFWWLKLILTCLFPTTMESVGSTGGGWSGIGGALLWLKVYPTVWSQRRQNLLEKDVFQVFAGLLIKPFMDFCRWLNIEKVPQHQK